MSWNIIEKDWFAIFNVKVTVRARITKTWLSVSIFWSADPFAARFTRDGDKLLNPECHAKRLVCYLQLQGQSHSESSYLLSKYGCFYSSLRTADLFAFELSLMVVLVHHCKPECLLKRLDCCVEGHEHFCRLGGGWGGGSFCCNVCLMMQAMLDWHWNNVGLGVSKTSWFCIVHVLCVCSTGKKLSLNFETSIQFTYWSITELADTSNMYDFLNTNLDYSLCAGNTVSNVLMIFAPLFACILAIQQKLEKPVIFSYISIVGKLHWNWMNHQWEKKQTTPVQISYAAYDMQSFC